jgi:hypothetical protein
MAQSPKGFRPSGIKAAGSGLRRTVRHLPIRCKSD